MFNENLGLRGAVILYVVNGSHVVDLLAYTQLG